MSKYDFYLERYSAHGPIFFKQDLDTGYDFIVVIPSYKEPNITNAIDSLLLTDAINKRVAILVIVNESEDADNLAKKANQTSLEHLEKYRNHEHRIPVYWHYVKLPPKKAGVGLARKIGMDEAIRWFSYFDKTGVIICFDADSTCEKNYFVEIDKHYDRMPLSLGLLYYEHPLDLDNGIVEYELHLRYYADSLRLANYPFAFQTLGSCITISSDLYVKHVGMNTRKAGEDFYFIHNIIPHESCADIVSTGIFPQARISDRVPFGTGMALSKFRENEGFTSYHPSIFNYLKEFLESITTKTFRFENSLLSRFFDQSKYKSQIIELAEKESNAKRYLSKLFQFFDGFQVLKFVHFLKDNGLESQHILTCIEARNDDLWKISDFKEMNIKEKLSAIRKWDRENPLSI